MNRNDRNELREVARMLKGANLPLSSRRIGNAKEIPARRVWSILNLLRVHGWAELVACDDGRLRWRKVANARLPKI